MSGWWFGMFPPWQGFWNETLTCPEAAARLEIPDGGHPSFRWERRRLRCLNSAIPLWAEQRRPVCTTSRLPWKVLWAEYSMRPSWVYRRCPDAAEPGLDGVRRVLLDPSATCGATIYLSDPLPLSLEATPDRDVERIDHLGVASADNTEVVEVFARKMGWSIESTQTDVEISTKTEAFTSDRYGVVYRNHQPEFVGGLRVSFITIGDLELEFLQNLDPSSVGIVNYGHSGSTRQDQGAISRYVESRGPGFHHTGLKVHDINGLLSRLDRRGLTLIDKEGRPGGRRSQIGFIHPASLGGWLVHLVQREESP